MADDTPWLDDEERRVWMALTGLLTRLEPAFDAQLRRDAGLRHFDYAVMAALSEAPERTLRMSRLAALAEGSLSRLSQVVSRLESRGLIERRPDPDDARANLATLTDAGWDAVVAAAPSHVTEVRRLVFDPLTRAQVRQLGQIAERIMGAVDAGDPPCHGGSCAGD